MTYILLISVLLGVLMVTYLVRREEQQIEEQVLNNQLEEKDSQWMNAERPHYEIVVEGKNNLEVILDHLKKFETITKQEAKDKYKVKNLPQCIHRLRLRGCKIENIVLDGVFIGYRLKYWKSR
jgi:hypothetical protein